MGGRFWAQSSLWPVGRSQFGITDAQENRPVVAPRVRELRELDDWRRFANAQRQEQLIGMAEAIVGSLDEIGTDEVLDLLAKDS